MHNKQTTESLLWLERALLFSIIVHGVAMVSMALILLPGMPGGGNSDADRVAYIANNPIIWRLGWLPWQITALSDLFIAVALLATSKVPRTAAIITAIFTLMAVYTEQPGEFLWVTEGVRLSQQALQTHDLIPYLQFEQSIFPRIAGWAAVFYSLAAIGWSFCLAGLGTWNRLMTGLSVVTWSLLLAVSVAPLLEKTMLVPPALVAGGNALGFTLLIAWMTLALELLLSRSRPSEPHGRMAHWQIHERGPLSWLVGTVSRSRMVRMICELLPGVELISDIEDVFYINYLVEADKLERFVPWGLELQRLGPDQNYALFSILTYTHHHFGPKFLGPLRQFCLSPIQSNWRIHVSNPVTGTAGIYFVTTAIASKLMALAARLLSDGVPMHVPRHCEISKTGENSWRVVLDPGDGSAPDLHADLLASSELPRLTGAWRDCFGDWNGFLSYCVPQDRAMSSQIWYQRICSQEINLGIPLSVCQPVNGTIRSAAVASIVDDADAVCFRVPAVHFCFSKVVYEPVSK